MRLLSAALLLGLLPFAAHGAVLRVCGFETPPFLQLEDGVAAGLEHDLLDSFARASGFELEYVWNQPYERFHELLEREVCHVVAASYTRTAEREARLDFTGSYFPARVVLVEPAEKASESVAVLQGERLATIRGTTYEKILAERVPDAELVYGSNARELFQQVSRGEARALACDSGIALYLLKDFPQLRITLALSDKEHYGFAFRQGSPLREALDRHLAQLRADGSYRRLLAKYFGDENAAAIEGGIDEPAPAGQ